MIKGKLFVRCWKNKDGFDCRALCVDLGYTQKFLIFKQQDIAELLGLIVPDFVSKYKIVDGVVSVYPVDLVPLE